jgi:hypothetical protein
MNFLRRNGPLHEVETHTTHSFFIGEFIFHMRKSKIFKIPICLGEEKLGYKHVSLQFSYYHTPIPYCHTMLVHIFAHKNPNVTH